MIPRIIHQLWIGDPTKRPAHMMETWKKLNPSCRYILWTEENLRYFEFENQKQIDLMGELNGKCDIMRWEILYRIGGFFADADSECIAPLDDFFFEQDAFACYESENECPGLVATGFMGCSSEHPLFRHAIDGLHSIEKFVGDAWVTCGPAYLTGLIHDYPQPPVTIYPSYYFIPEHGWDGYKYSGEGKIYSHHYGGSTFKIYGTLK